MYIRFIPNQNPQVPEISLKGLIDHPQWAAQLRGKVVFVGLTAITAVNDRLFTPKDFKTPTSGVQINADAFETMAQGLFITDVSDSTVLLFSLGLLLAAGLAFRYLPGWWAYAGGARCWWAPSSSRTSFSRTSASFRLRRRSWWRGSAR